MKTKLGKHTHFELSSIPKSVEKIKQSKTNNIRESHFVYY